MVVRQLMRGGPSGGHFHLPAQLFLGLFFMITGALVLLKKFGRDYIPFIPEEFLLYVVAFGSLIGGFYLLITKLWRPRIYL